MVYSSTKMKLLPLLCLGLTLVRAHGQVMRSNFDASKFSGKWFSILLASEQKEKIEENSSMRIFVEDIQALEDGSLAFKFHKMVNEECTELHFITKKENDGVYTVEYDGHNIFHVLETDYEDYMILYLKNFNKGNTFQLLELYGRIPDLILKLKEKFRKICEEHGIVQENILDLTRVDRCLYLRDGREDCFFFSRDE